MRSGTCSTVLRALVTQHSTDAILYSIHQAVVCVGSCDNRAIGKVFKGKAIEKGVAFPTCVSVNRYAKAVESCTQHCCAWPAQPAGDGSIDPERAQVPL